MSYRWSQSRENAEKRHDHRFSRPLQLIAEGQTLDAGDWGFGGFKADGLKDLGLSLDEEFLVSHIIDGHGVPQPVFAIARIARIDLDSGAMAAAFVSLGERAFQLLEQAMFRKRQPTLAA